MHEYAPGELNPVVEVVAKTLFESFYTSTWPPVPYDSELRSADDWRSAARAAILKMRVPTQAMVEACGSGPMRPEVIWRAMIDEAAR